MTRRRSPEDRYRLERVLGEGGSGRVWLVEDSLSPGSRLALKELSASTAGGLRHEEQLRAEFATLATLRHPNLVEVHEYDAAPASGLPRFTLEFIRGTDIVDAVATEGPAAFLDLAAEALRALGFLHDFDLVHRDLKPANVLVRDQPKLGCRLVLVDFGLARTEADESLEALRAQGTLPYLAPEIFRNEGASRRSDLYSLGAVLYEAVFGHPPFVMDEKNLNRFIQSVTEGRRSRPSLPDGYPSGLGNWFTEVLAPEPGDRPARAFEALARLNEACGTEYPAETPATRSARLMSGLPGERADAVAEIWGCLDPTSGPRIVWLVGSPGMGKTRLLRWLEADCVRRGWHVATPGSGQSPELDRLRDWASANPTVLLLDEEDTVQGSSVDLMERVAREPAAPPLQVVAAIRPDQAREPSLRNLYAGTGTVPTLRKVALDRLDAKGIRAMAARATGGRVSDERVQWLVRASEGSPAAVESLLIEGAWERGGPPELARIRPGACPGGRLEILTAGSRRWLESLSILGSGAENEDLAALAGMEPPAARGAAEEAVAAGLAYRKRGRWRAESRALIEQLRSDMRPARRADLSKRAAGLLETRLGGRADPWTLSRLWNDAGRADLAAEYAVRAAELSEGSGHPAEAASRYGRALLRLGRERERRHELRLRQADACMQAGLHAWAARAYGSAARFSPSAGARTRALTRQAHALVQAGRFELALAVADRAATMASRAGDRTSLAQAKMAAGVVHGRLGRERDAIRLLETARALFREGDDPEGESETLQVLAACRLRLGDDGAERDFHDAIELRRSAAADAETPGQDLQELKARIGLAVIRARRREFDEAVRILEGVRKTADDLGNTGLRHAALSRLSDVAIDEGKLDRAMALAEKAADLAQYLGDQNRILVDHCRLADARIRCGRAGEAMTLLRQTLDLPPGRIEPDNADYARMLLASAWMESGGADEDNLKRMLDECVARCTQRRKPRALLMALVIEMERRARPASQDPLEPVSARFESVLQEAGGDFGAEIRIRARLARAAFHLAGGDPEVARLEAKRAGRIAQECATPAFGARARALLADALDRLGLSEDAEAALRAGQQLLEKAAEKIEDDDVRSDFLRRPVYANLSRHDSLAGRRNQSRLVTLYDMIGALNSQTDPDALLESILDMALRAVNAERGMILLKEDREGVDDDEAFSVHLVRNLEAETVEDAQSFSRSIVAEAGAGKSLLAIDAGEDQRFRDLKSVSLYGIRSLMCAPLRSRGKIIGTVYLDNRREGMLFTPEDLRFLEAFANHAALALENVHARARLEQHNRRLQAVAETRTSFGNLVGRSPGMQAVFDLIEKVAATDLPVLILGESGTGKELVARAIHFHGLRRRRMFVTENCAAIPETLLESALFGHVRGAFTGAERDHPGLFEQADRGTLFLDEIGDMSAAMQAKLLRVLEEGEIRRVGGEKTISVDVRVLAATHQDLRAAVKAGRFRQDLLYRLQVLTIEIPPLRERPGDVRLLAKHLSERIAKERGHAPTVIEEGALRLLERYRWPGNVRELDNALQRLLLLAGDGPITSDVVESDPDLRRALLRDARSREPAFSLAIGEKEQVRRALAAARGDRNSAARLLGVSRATLYRKLKKHGL